MATYANLFVDQGSDFQTSVILEDSAGDPLDLTELSFQGQIRRTPQSDTAFDFEIINSETIAGGIVLRLSNTISSDMSPGRYVYDVFAVDSGFGTRFKVLEGLVEIIPRVTRIEND